MTRIKQQKRTGLGLLIGIICTMIGVAWMPGLAGATPALLPPIGTLTPYPTGQATPIPTPTSAATATPIPTVQPEATGAFIALQTPAGWAGKWTVVQWQDGLGRWHDVEGWVGAINNDNQVIWTVQAAERGGGPYRWLVYTAVEGDFIAASDPFYAPWPLGHVTWVRVPASPAAAPEAEVRNQMRVRPPEGEWLWLASAPSEWRTVAWLKAGSVVTVIGGPEEDAGGQSWLQVRTGSGWIGWCRASIDGMATLVEEATALSAQQALPVTTVTGVQVGARVRVQPAAAEWLRMHHAPSVDSGNAAWLMSGSVVTIVAGPETDADGQSWWQVETGSGWIGWCRASIDGTATLVEETPAEAPPVTAATGLQIGARVQVPPGYAGWVRMHHAPSVDSGNAAWLKPGSVVTIIGGPETDADGQSWWQVMTASGWTGWCRESIDGATTLAPMGLEVGIEATVHTGGEIALQLRSGAGALNQVVAAMAQGERVTLIDGPVKDESGLWWWQVRTDEGEIGWCVDYYQGVQTLVP